MFCNLHFALVPHYTLGIKFAFTRFILAIFRFYHGRTETCRTCLPEVVHFCRALIDGESRTQLVSLLRSAHDRMVWLMKECQNNRGCDRHFFGLAHVAAVRLLRSFLRFPFLCSTRVS